MDRRADMVTGARSATARAGQVSLATVAVAAASLAWAMSARLAGTAVSIGYLIGARSFAAGAGLLNPAGEPYTLYGPAYPVVLGWLSELGVSLLTAARLVSAVSLGASALLAGVWVRRLTGSWWSAPVGGMAAVVLAPALTTRAVWPEPLFIAVALAGGLCVAVALQRHAAVWLAAGGALFGLGAVIRYAGLVLLLVVVYVAAVWSRSWRARAGASAAFLAPAVAIAGAMVGRNLAVAPGEPLGPRLPSTMTPAEVAEDAVRGVADLVVPLDVPLPVQLFVLAVGTAAVVWLALSLRGRRPGVWWRDVALPFLLAAVYLAGNLFAALTTKLDPLVEGRLLVPCAPFAAVGAVSVAWAASRQLVRPTHATATTPAAGRHRVDRRRAALAVGPPVVLLVAALAATGYYGTRLQPRERLSPEVAASPVLNAIDDIGRARLVSDEATNAAWVSGRPVLPAPSYRGDPPPDPDPGDLYDFESLRAPGRTVLIWTGDGEPGQVELEVLGELCDLQLRSRHADGEIYEVRGCRSSGSDAP